MLISGWLSVLRSACCMAHLVMTWILATWAFLLSTSRSVHVRNRPLGPWLASNASCASSRTSPMRWSTWTENGLKKQTKWWQTLRATWRRERYTMSLGQLNGWLFVWEEPLRDAGIEEPLQTLRQVFFERPQTWTWLTRRQTEEKGVSQLYIINKYIKRWKTKNILKHICRIPFCSHFFGYFTESSLSKHLPKKWSLKKTRFKCTKNTTDEIRWNPYRKIWSSDEIRTKSVKWIFLPIFFWKNGHLPNLF